MATPMQRRIAEYNRLMAQRRKLIAAGTSPRFLLKPLRPIGAVKCQSA